MSGSVLAIEPIAKAYEEANCDAFFLIERRIAGGGNITAHDISLLMSAILNLYNLVDAYGDACELDPNSDAELLDRFSMMMLSPRLTMNDIIISDLGQFNPHWFRVLSSALVGSRQSTKPSSNMLAILTVLLPLMSSGVTIGAGVVAYETQEISLHQAKVALQTAQESAKNTIQSDLGDKAAPNLILDVVCAFCQTIATKFDGRNLTITVEPASHATPELLHDHNKVNAIHEAHKASLREDDRRRALEASERKLEEERRKRANASSGNPTPPKLKLKTRGAS